jgi:hypothetical protein
LQKKIKLSITQACAEFCAFDVMKGHGFQNLAKSIFDTGRFIQKSSIQIKDLLPHPTTVRMINYFIRLITFFTLTFF